jgi:alpha-mannosidase
VPGKWCFRYAILPHQGDWRESYQQAFAFQTGLRAVETGLHAGEIPAQGAFLSSSPGAFEISAVKAAENGDGWLVRGYNIASETIKMQLKPLRRFTQAALVNLAEQTISSLSPVDDGSTALSVTGHQVTSVRLSD